MRTPAGFFFGAHLFSLGCDCHMKFNKPPLTVDDQIALLIQRGMLFSDKVAAHQALYHINYYRLRAYWLPFENTNPDGSHTLQPGTTFETVMAYYAFDQRLKLLLIDAIERIEISLRTRWANELALRYGSHAYLDVNLFANHHRHAKCLQSLQEEVTRSHETFIKHYVDTYTHPLLPPIWAVCEVMTLGQLSQWLDNLKRRNDRQAISQPYGFDEVVIRAFAHHLATVRNLCAHHSRVWNRKFTISMKLPNQPASSAAWFNENDERKIYNTLLMLTLLLERVSPGSTWKHRLLELLETMPAGTMGAMGFPREWQAMAIWVH